ncbi:hypothetical protein RB200_38900 [Streptomyces sp. PmtG]
MAIEVAAIAASGATSTVVGLAVTEAWTQVRTRLTGLFGRRRAHGATDDDQELRAAVEQLAASLQSDSTHAVGDCADQLRRRLRHSLRQGSETARELVDLLSEVSGWEDEPVSGGARSQGAANPSVDSSISYHVPEALRRQGPPSQVPALRHHFINRSAELAVLNGQLDRDADPSHVDVRVLAGPPGVGKSALARYWAHARQTRECFSDGRIYVDFAALRRHAGRGCGRHGGRRPLSAVPRSGRRPPAPVPRRAHRALP